MFGAWQAGVWRALAPFFSPDLVVGASVGSLNGYVIASGWTPEELCSWWRRSPVEGIRHTFGSLPEIARSLVAARPLEREYALVMVDLLRMRPRTVVAPHVTARHLLASCAVPGVVAPRHIDGAWWVDGGLLNPLPVWAAVELGATDIVAVNALPEVPSKVLQPFVKGFRAVFGHHPPLPPGVRLVTILPNPRLGSLTDAMRWRADNIERWIEQGEADALANVSALKCFEG